MSDQFDRDMVADDAEETSAGSTSTELTDDGEHHLTDGGATKVNANAEMELPEFDIHVETCVMEDVDAGEQVVMWRAYSDNEVSRSSSPMDAVMEVIERETGGVV